MSRRSRRRAGARMESAAVELDDGPEKTGPGQIFAVEKIAKGSGKGIARRHRNIGEHPLVLARARGKISADEYAAGAIYRSLCEKLHRSGKDSTIVVIKGSDLSQPWTQEQVDAVRTLERIDSVIGQQNGLILRKFCGDGTSMSEAVMRYVPCHPNGVIWRVKEALSKLDESLRSLRIRCATVEDPVTSSK